MFTPSNLTFAYFFHMACGSTQSPNLVPAFFLSVFTPPPQAAPQRDSEEAEDVKLSSTSEEGAKRNERRGSFGGTETNKNWRFGWLSVAFERFGTLIHSFFFVRDDVYIYIYIRFLFTVYIHGLVDLLGTCVGELVVILSTLILVGWRIHRRMRVFFHPRMRLQSSPPRWLQKFLVQPVGPEPIVTKIGL